MCKVEVEVGEMVAGYVVGVFNGDNRWRYVTRTLESATLLKKKKYVTLLYVTVIHHRFQILCPYCNILN